MNNPYKNLTLNCFSILLLFCLLPVFSQNIQSETSFGGKQADYLFDAQPTLDYGYLLAGSSLSGISGNKKEKSNGDLDYWVWKMNEKGGLDWQKSFGGSEADLLQSIKNTNDGGFILAGTSNSPIGFQKKDSCRGLTDFWVIKLDAKGQEQWQKTIGGDGQDELHEVIQTKDGGYMLGGSSSSSPQSPPKEGEKTKLGIENKPDLYGKSEDSRGNLDFWLVKLDKTGLVQWQKTIGGEYLDLLQSLEQTIDGGYIIGGYSNSPSSGEKTDDVKGIGDYWIVKIDPKGKIEWQKTFGGNGDDKLHLVHQTADGGYIVGGNSNSTETLTSVGGNVKNGTDYWVIKLDKMGSAVWSKTYDFGKWDVLTSLVENKDHSYLIGGFTADDPFKKTSKKTKEKEGVNDFIALKISETGEEIWSQTAGSEGKDVLSKLIETRDGGYVLAGTSDGNVTIAPTKKQSQKTKNTSKQAQPLEQQTQDNLPASRDKKTNYGKNDFWVVKLKDQNKNKSTDTKPSLKAIPNPVSSFTNIIIGFEFATGTATLVDLNGRTLEHFNISSRTLPIDLSNYPDGVYIVNVKTNTQSGSLKVIKKGLN